MRKSALFAQGLLNVEPCRRFGNDFCSSHNWTFGLSTKIQYSVCSIINFYAHNSDLPYPGLVIGFSIFAWMIQILTPVQQFRQCIVLAYDSFHAVNSVVQ